MVEQCGPKCAKFLLVIFNLLFFVCGLTLCGLAIYSVVNNPYGQQLENFHATVAILAGVGAFVALVSFLGCLGAYKENRCFLGVFVIIVAVLFILECSAAVALLVMKSSFEGKIAEFLANEVKAANTSADANTALKKMEKEFDCCAENHEDCGADEQYADTKCSTIIWQDIKNNAILVGAVGLAVLLIEILAILLACCLCRAITRDVRHSGYA